MTKVFEQISTMLGLVLMVQILPVLTGAFGALGGLGRPAAPTATPGPSDADILIQRERDIGQFERDVRAGISGELRTTAEERALFGPGVTREDVYGKQQAAPQAEGRPESEPAQRQIRGIALPAFVPLGITTGGAIPIAKQQAAPIELGRPESTGWEAGRIVGHRITGGVEYNIIATGMGKGVSRVAV